MAGSANIGKECAMFEAIHGSAPDIADLNVANPSGLLQAACMMLVHIGQAETAAKIINAWQVTLEEGIHTADIFKEDESNELVGTSEFADAVIANLGEVPGKLPAIAFRTQGAIKIPDYKRPVEKKRLIGVDVFIDWPGNNASVLGEKLAQIKGKGNLGLKMITNRGVKVYPGGIPETFLTDHWRCRFVAFPENPETTRYGTLDQNMIMALLTRLVYEGHEIIKTENLYEFSDQAGYSLGQGE
jgi:isocitrate dehydrogenase